MRLKRQQKMNLVCIKQLRSIILYHKMQSFYLKERNKYYDKKNAKIIIDKMPLNIFI